MLKSILKYLSTAVSYLLYKWLVVIIQLIIKICRARKNRKREKASVPRRIRKASKYECIPIRHPNYHRPDPMIYSQYFLMKQGLAVTWDNPDIQLYKNGAAVASHTLQPDTEYEIVARCWNLSYDAPVVGMPVIFTYLDFGAGTSQNMIGQTTTNLSVIGGSENPNYAKVKWRTPPVAGHYCIQVRLMWSDDKNPQNNLGQENVDVVEAQSPAIFNLTVRNETKQTRRYHIETDTYVIPPLLPCADYKKVRARKKELVLSRNNRSNYPVPSNWTIEYNEENFSLLAGEEKKVKVSVTPPKDYKGEQPINFNVFDEENNFIGGVTITVLKK